MVQSITLYQAWVKYIEYLYLVVFKSFFQYLYLYLHLSVSSRKNFVFVFKYSTGQKSSRFYTVKLCKNVNFFWLVLYIPIVFETSKIHSKYPVGYYIRALINLAVIYM